MDHSTPEKQQNTEEANENPGVYKSLSIRRKKRPEPRDESDITVRILNYLSASGHDMNDDDSLGFKIQRFHIVHKLLNRSGYYYGNIPYHRADRLLMTHPLGTFLIRDSHQADHLYAMSFKDHYGIVHLRILFQRGFFTLYDDFDRVGVLSYGFESVTDLVDHYINRSPVSRVLVFGRPAMYEVPSLKHQCLKFVAKRLKESQRALSIVVVRQLGLTPSLAEEVKEYAFPLECVRERLRLAAQRGM